MTEEEQTIAVERNRAEWRAKSEGGTYIGAAGGTRQCRSELASTLNDLHEEIEDVLGRSGVYRTVICEIEFRDGKFHTSNVTRSKSRRATKGQ